MIRDEDGALTANVYLDLKTKDYGGLVDQAASSGVRGDSITNVKPAPSPYLNKQLDVTQFGCPLDTAAGRS